MNLLRPVIHFVGLYLGISVQAVCMILMRILSWPAHMLWTFVLHPLCNLCSTDPVAWVLTQLGKGLYYLVWQPVHWAWRKIPSFRTIVGYSWFAAYASSLLGFGTVMAIISVLRFPCGLAIYCWKYSRRSFWRPPPAKTAKASPAAWTSAPPPACTDPPTGIVVGMGQQTPLLTGQSRLEDFLRMDDYFFTLLPYLHEVHLLSLSHTSKTIRWCLNQHAINNHATVEKFKCRGNLRCWYCDIPVCIWSNPPHIVPRDQSRSTSESSIRAQTSLFEGCAIRAVVTHSKTRQMLVIRVRTHLRLHAFWVSQPRCESCARECGKDERGDVAAASMEMLKDKETRKLASRRKRSILLDDPGRLESGLAYCAGCRVLRDGPAQQIPRAYPAATAITSLRRSHANAVETRLPMKFAFINSFRVYVDCVADHLTNCPRLVHCKSPEIFGEMGLLPREGITVELLTAPIRNVLLQPLFTAPLLLALLRYPNLVEQYLPDYAQKIVFEPNFLKYLKYVVGIGAVRATNNFLSRKVVNNWRTVQWKKEQEIVLITGGASGLGELLAHTIAKTCKKVIVFDLRPSKKSLRTYSLSFRGPRVTKHQASNALFYEADVTDSARLKTLAVSYIQCICSEHILVSVLPRRSTHSIQDEIRRDHGAPTVLVNCAGVGCGATILSETEEWIRRTFNVNIISHFLTVKEFLPEMIKNNHGHVVTIASIATFVTIPQVVDYSCTKAAALAFHEGLAMELKTRYNADKVRATVVHPWWVRTPMIEKLIEAGTWTAPTMEPETVVDAIVAQLHSGEGGQIILPRHLAIVSMLKGFPSWLQHRIRASEKETVTVSL
ncbi:hypothetical protein MRB53_038249 [Persea americana]|nr:hypothetical protein MRB53_038249 [Persea americana]